MNCVEFERVLPEFLEGDHTREQQAHLDSCPVCSSLFSDLNLISEQAKSLLAAEEPSPRVWKAIEAQLRSEGLILDKTPANPIIVRPLNRPRWRMAWLVPVAAALALVVGLKLYHPAGAGDNAPVAKAPIRVPTTPIAVSSEDQQVLNSVATRVPAQRARYTADLDDANAFIRDAEQSMKDDPNDIYTQKMLMNAYAQKQMLYDLAVNRGTGQ